MFVKLQELQIMLISVFENIQVKILKKRLNKAHNVKAQRKKVKKVQEDFQKLLFTSDLLE